MSATQRELLEARWSALTIATQRFVNEVEPSVVNGKRYRRIADTMEELGVLLIGEVNEQEYGVLTDLVAGEMWDAIHDRLLAWAEQTEAQRDARRAA